MIRQKSELSKAALYLPKWINSFYTFKLSEMLVAKFMCFGYSVQIFIYLDGAWRDLIKDLSFNELLLGMIRNESPLFSFFFFF